MAESQRIEDLRKRYHENPRRFFAPLANEYRKAGFLDRSLLLCEKHLKEQPDNLNGLVVYGQTLFESGKHAEARQPFEAALGLDQENLIALRHLGDIARLDNDVATAKKWYEKVLELDRRNDEVLDLLQHLGGGEAAAPDAPAGNVPFVTVASSVSVSSADDPSTIGMVDLDAAAPPPPPKAPKAKSPIKTMVIDAAALAAGDLKKAQAAAAPTKEIEAQRPPAPPATTAPTREIEPPVAPARPSKRASLLDINFDFSEMPAEDAAPATPAAPVTGAEAAEYAFVPPAADAEPIGRPEPVEESMAAMGGGDTLIIDHSHSGDSLAGTPVAGIAGLETTEMGSGGDVAPMAGLEATEFTSGDAAPLAELEPGEVEPGAVVAAVAGLDRADAVDAPSPTADLPMLEVETVKATKPATPPPPPDSLSVEPPSIELDIPSESPPLPFIEEPPSARPKPRMTKSDMSSLPLLADYGLEDDEPTTTPIIDPAPIVEAPSASEPRKPQKTPAFVTETMAMLYIKQGYKKEAIDVYRQLIAQDPNDDGLKQRLAALERGDDTGLDFEPPPAGTPEPEPAPANAVLADVSFAGVGLNTPAPSAPKLVMPNAVGPSARDFFGNFARRAAAAAVATAATAASAATAAAAPALSAAAEPPAPVVSTTGWPLDALFGAASDVTDLHAAEVLAGVATFAGPSGGTGLDQLFAGNGSEARPMVTRASQTLKFDQFFAGGAAAQGSATAPAATNPAAADGDDLDKFQGWLKKLKPQ